MYLHNTYPFACKPRCFHILLLEHLLEPGPLCPVLIRLLLQLYRPLLRIFQPGLGSFERFLSVLELCLCLVNYILDVALLSDAKMSSIWGSHLSTNA